MGRQRSAVSVEQGDGRGCPGVKEMLLLQLQTNAGKSQAQRGQERGWEECRTPPNPSHTVPCNSQQKPNVPRESELNY